MGKVLFWCLIIALAIIVAIAVSAAAAYFLLHPR
jgi:hypothetical protein